MLAALAVLERFRDKVTAVKRKSLVCTQLLALLLLVLHSGAQNSGQAKHYWSETDSETLWRTRYNNCDYGYYVLLGPGVVAHDTLPPAPNHGFLIPLPDVGRTTYVSGRESRLVWVDASYDVWDDHPSLAGAVRQGIGISMEDEAKHKPKLVEREPMRLAGIPAVSFKVVYISSNGSKGVEEQTVALRSDIVYTVGLSTTESNLSADEARMKKILAGFKLLKLPQGECIN